MIKIFFISTLFLFYSQQDINTVSLCKKHCISNEEMKLYNLINEYRKENKLPAIPLSKSLSYVAKKHVMDMDENLKEMTHSWSTCKYNASNNKTFTCMWLKPSELTNYKSNGYECVYSISDGDVLAEEALDTWKTSTAHNNVILNKSIWSSMKWNALGVGIYKNYAAIWFGEDLDEEEIPNVCN